MNICVFCSSSKNIDAKYLSIAKELIKHFINKKHKLIYGGANIGIMGAVSNEALNNGIKVTSVIPEKIFNTGVANPRIQELIKTKTMHERKKTMEDLSDAFIILPGGFGTLEELIEVITLKQLGYHNKPIIIINSYNFFNPLLKVFKKFYDEKFTKPAFKKLYYLAKNTEDAFLYLNNYTETENISKF